MNLLDNPKFLGSIFTKIRTLFSACRTYINISFFCFVFQVAAGIHHIQEVSATGTRGRLHIHLYLLCFWEPCPILPHYQHLHVEMKVLRASCVHDVVGATSLRAHSGIMRSGSVAWSHSSSVHIVHIVPNRKCMLLDTLRECIRKRWYLLSWVDSLIKDKTFIKFIYISFYLVS